MTVHWSGTKETICDRERNDGAKANETHTQIIHVQLK